MKKIVLGIFVSLFLVLMAQKSAFASEGDLLLRNTQGGPSRCAARSVLMPDFQYTILITCRDLIYPVNPEVLHYIVWAQPLNSNTPLKLGDLGFGKVQFRTKDSFSSIFVTQERADSRNLREPGTVVMRGNVRTIPELENPTAIQNPDEEPTIASPSPSPQPSGSLLSRFRTGAIITVVSIFLIILMLILVKPFK